MVQRTVYTDNNIVHNIAFALIAIWKDRKISMKIYSILYDKPVGAI